MHLCLCHGSVNAKEAQQYFPPASGHFSSDSHYLGIYDSCLPFWFSSYLSVHSFSTSVPHLQPQMSEAEPLTSLSTFCSHVLPSGFPALR